MSARLGDVITSRPALETVPVGAILRDVDNYVIVRADETDWLVIPPFSDDPITVDAGEIDGAYNVGEGSEFYPLKVTLLPSEFVS